MSDWHIDSRIEFQAKVIGQRPRAAPCDDDALYRRLLASIEQWRKGEESQVGYSGADAAVIVSNNSN